MKLFSTFPLWVVPAPPAVCVSRTPHCGWFPHPPTCLFPAPPTVGVSRTHVPQTVHHACTHSVGCALLCTGRCDAYLLVSNLLYSFGCTLWCTVWYTFCCTLCRTLAVSSPLSCLLRFPGLVRHRNCCAVGRGKGSVCDTQGDTNGIASYVFSVLL